VLERDVAEGLREGDVGGRPEVGDGVVEVEQKPLHVRQPHRAWKELPLFEGFGAPPGPECEGATPSFVVEKPLYGAMMVGPMEPADDGVGLGNGPRARRAPSAQTAGVDDWMASKKSEGGDWPSEPFEVTDANIEEMAAKYPRLIVDCWAEWCGPCRMLGPTIHELAGELQGKVAFGKLNTDSNPKLPRKYGIMSIPDAPLLQGRSGGGKTVGALPKEYILEPSRRPTARCREVDDSVRGHTAPVAPRCPIAAKVIDRPRGYAPSTRMST